MRVLQLSWEYPPVIYGGLGRHVHALAEALAAAGHEVTVVTQREKSPQDAAYRETVAGVRVLRVSPDPPLLPQTDLLAWVMGFDHAVTRAALRAAMNESYDVIHAHDWLVSHAAKTIKDIAGLPLIATIHATEAGRHQGWLPGHLNKAIHTVEWWLTSESAMVITCSEHMRWETSKLFDLPPDKLAVIPNGIDLKAWQRGEAAVAATREQFALRPEAPLILFSGRLEYEKGVQTAVRALLRLRRRHPGLRLVIAGRGSYEQELAAEIRRLRLESGAIFAGWLEQGELAALAAAADCVVVPSIYEPFGMVALEAAASATPIVAADTGGLREIVDHEETGLLVPPDDPESLTDAVSAVLRDEGLARRLVGNAHEMVARDYTWDSVAARTIDVYERARTREPSALPSPETDYPTTMIVPEGNLLAR